MFMRPEAPSKLQSFGPELEKTAVDANYKGAYKNNINNVLFKHL